MCRLDGQRLEVVLGREGAWRGAGSLGGIYMLSLIVTVAENEKDLVHIQIIRQYLKTRSMLLEHRTTSWSRLGFSKVLFSA